MSTQVRAPAVSLRVFLEHLIDYAGLFAPASLDMATSVNNYARYLNHPQRWALGRFVLPVARLDEFLNAQENVAAERWQLSGIIAGDIEAELAAVDQYNRKASGAVMDCIEVHTNSLDEMDRVRAHQPAGTTVWFEIAPERVDELLPILRHVGGRAKLRTGGVVKDAFPAMEQVARFVARCAELGVPFKASAGLHHPLCCVRPFTYAENSPEGVMHGFLNLFTAAAMAWSRVHAGSPVPRSAIATCLADSERANWHFGEDALTWSGEDEPVRIDLENLRTVRSKFALSFGSCSFEEPIQDLRELDLL
jgi:hypothetical protein